jgi:hypothetical protein
MHPIEQASNLMERRPCFQRSHISAFWLSE